jgi:DNA-binding MarR family transcriptional regulator
MLARLETSGFVTRSRSESDRRVVEISLTETGREISGRLPEGKRSYLLMQMETLGQEELHRLSEAMSLLVGMLKTPEVP